MENGAYRIELRQEGSRLHARLVDRASGFALADGPYLWRMERSTEEGASVSEWILGPMLAAGPERLTITGRLSGLEVIHTFDLPAARPIMEERLVLRNAGTDTVRLRDFQSGFTRRITDHFGNVLAELASDRFAAVPFRHRAADPADVDMDMSFADLLRLSGREPRANEAPLSWPMWGSLPAPGWGSEGWAWERGGYALSISKCNQEGMELSLIAAVPDDHGAVLCFGGAGMFAGDPSCLREFRPGQSVSLGVTRYQTVANDRREAWYAFRRLLDEHGCRFPDGFDPPVHWNELYDNPEWNLGSPGTPPAGPTRQVTYTRALLEEEAARAVEYGCQNLYLDPGWDTAFGTFLWGEEWLGPRRSFVDGIRKRFGLGVSLHCPLATWMSLDGRGLSTWPRESFQARPDGTVIEGAVCLGSRQYLDEAEKRLLAHCADGVGFLMFDGNWWNGGCGNPAHGHPVPSTMEDHARAQVDLARRIHARYPKVLIEMHDMVSGGVAQRHTPVYYKHGLPGSYDENWGFELMWQPMEDILAGRARSLYWYNLGCNVPVYLHVDLRDDNEHCLVLWWYASTCRHLGIGGTHPDPRVADEQKRAMRSYRRLDRFYKHGDFYGMHEEAHVHALPVENAFVVNLFNLSDQSRIVEGTVNLARMGLDPDRWYVTPKGARWDRQSGTFVIGRRMAPRSSHVAEVRSIET
jgi:hypothetical protein